MGQAYTLYRGPREDDLLCHHAISPSPVVLERLAIQATDVNVQNTPNMGVPSFIGRTQLSDY